MTRCSTTALLLALVVLGTGGCAGRRGVSLDMFVAESGERAMLFKLDDSGTLSYGGGQDALAGRTSWSHKLTDDQVREIRQLVEPWIEQEPKSTGQPPETRYDVTVITEKGRRRFELKGDSPEMASVRAYLHGIAEQRFDRIIEALPEAGDQRR